MSENSKRKISITISQLDDTHIALCRTVQNTKTFTLLSYFKTKKAAAVIDRPVYVMIAFYNSEHKPMKLKINITS